MSPERHMTWDNFRETLLSPGVPALHPVRHAGSPDVELFVDADASRLGLRTVAPAGKVELSSPLAAIEVGLRLVRGNRVVEVSTRTVALHQQFYAFMVDIADRIQLGGRPPAAAIAEALDDWNALLLEASVMSVEAQTGLFGELWCLERLHRSEGAEAVDAWVGPLGEPHDFRRGDVEIEVKTTRSAERVHVISGLHQLEPSIGRALFLLSLQAEPAGARSGETLPERVARLRALLSAVPGPAAKFDRLLVRTGYRDEDAPHYRRRLRLRTPPLLVPVDHRCPKLVSEHVRMALGESLAARLSDVRYRVRLSGLGFEDGTPDFLTLLP
ncbi:PD-(D/E)XK motif protein [Myxococcus sp. AM010]|uniref:PD-(D/E)XK motif protein n=1 Tax=Myxococcus sp. AM010 TaxID=2745138 RepID=UPI0015951CD3|nr:PD-(D/E)XK motif protein [Myxococcus sp. AM010]NVJ19161.1 PD-(D/E)XK motif protein [Myxococcus sp. AM010]